MCDFDKGWTKSQLLTKVKLWPKLISCIPWMDDEWNELELDVKELIDNEVTKWNLHEVGF